MSVLCNTQVFETGVYFLLVGFGGLFSSAVALLFTATLFPDDRVLAR